MRRQLRRQTGGSHQTCGGPNDFRRKTKFETVFENAETDLGRRRGSYVDVFHDLVDFSSVGRLLLDPLVHALRFEASVEEQNDFYVVRVDGLDQDR